MYRLRCASSIARRCQRKDGLCVKTEPRTIFQRNLFSLSPTTSTLNNIHDLNEPFELTNRKMYLLDQYRHMGRKDGNKSFFKTRPPTRKQKKKYHKRMRELHHEKVGRHSKPGSKAGPRREYIENEHQYLVGRAKGEIPEGPPQEFLEYDFGNAIVDDLMGSSSFLTSTPTPKPIYLGKSYDSHYSKVLTMMQEYHAHLQLAKDSGDTEEKALAPPLPTDQQLSLLIRSYRDRFSSRNKPVGIVNALRFLISELKIPTSMLGPKSYSSLMLCAASPKEARRIMKLMEENGETVDAYIYSILIDIYAKQGDYRGADSVLSEMRFEGVEPTLAAYTSLVAACYKVINKASIPQSIKAEAGNLAWDRWKELRINDLEPDVMSYGSIIRIMAARGFPEKAINLIEEMQMNDINPTTLIFSSALKAVARSHANALRFEGGRSKKNKRREKIAAHHGKMTKQIVVLAEQADVEQDDGFVSALMLCAGTAGDFATAKAVYLASEVRKLEHLRTIGGPEHLQALRGESVGTNVDPVGISDGSSAFTVTDGKPSTNDNAVEIVDDVENSLKLVYKSDKKRKDTRKLNALLSASANAVEKRTLADIWQGRENKGFLDESSLRNIQLRYTPTYVDKSIPGMTSDEAGRAGMVWDDDQDVEKMGKRLRRKKFMGLIEDPEGNTIDDLEPELYDLFVEDEDVLFGEETKEISEGEFSDQIVDTSTKNEINNEGNTTTVINGADQQELFEDETESEQLQQLLVSEQMGRKMMEHHGLPGQTMEDIINSDDISDDEIAKMLEASGVDEKTLEGMFSEENIEEGMSEAEIKLFNSIMNENELTEDERRAFENMMLDDSLDMNEELEEEAESLIASLSAEDEEEESSLTVLDDSHSIVALPEDADDLDLVLYGLPQNRVDKVRDEFKLTLGTPSMIRLVPLLRENIPENIDRNWLIEKNLRDTESVIEMAKEEDVVDSHLMNSMLQVYCKAGRPQEAVACYEKDFKDMQMTPNTVSDRNVFQMMIERRDVTGALEFKEKHVEGRGKKLDLLSYGSLIEHYGNRQQIGNAILALKECIQVHGSPPGERSLRNLRQQCKQQDITEEVGLDKLIGEDPLDWLREGEGYYKREHSKKGKSNLLMTKNRLLRI